MGRIIWGLILIGIGILFFGRNLGWTNVDIAQFLDQYWPLILIIIGLIILADILKSVILRVISIVIVIALFAIPFIFSDSLPQIKTSTKNQTVSVDLQNANLLDFSLETGAVDLKIDGQVFEDKAVIGEIKSDFMTLEKFEKKTANTLKVDISSSGQRYWAINLKSIKSVLGIHLNPNIITEIDLDLGASSVNADLSQIDLKELNLDVGASSLNLKLGEKNKVSEITIEAGAANINLDIPKNIGGQVVLDGGLNSKNLEDFDEVSDNLFQTENYGSAEKKIIIKANLGAASFTIDRY